MKWNNNATFSGCSKDSWSALCVVEMILTVTISLLLTIEILQLTSGGLRAYFTNFENMIELSIITLASICLGMQEYEEYEKWVAAFGIVLAYIGNEKSISLELLFLFYLMIPVDVNSI